MTWTIKGVVQPNDPNI